MLAAVPSESARTLELFRLVLSMLEDDPKAVPPHLQQHFDETLQQAMELSEGHWPSEGALLPEAIQLAAYMVNAKGMKEDLRLVNSSEKISHVLANSILQRMEPAFAV